MRLLIFVGLICLGCYLWATKENLFCNLISKHLGYQLKTEKIAFELPHQVTLCNLRIYTKAGSVALTTEKLTITWAWKDLLHSPLHLKQVMVESPQLQMTGVDAPTAHPNEENTSSIKRIKIDKFVVLTHPKKSKVDTMQIELGQIGGTQGEASDQLLNALFAKLLDSPLPPFKNASPAPVPSDKPHSEIRGLDNVRRHLHHVF